MSKRIISYALTCILVLSFMTLGLTYANDDRALLTRIQRDIDATTNELEQGRRQEQNLVAQIAALDNQANAIQAEINAIRGDIDATRAKIREAQINIEQLEADLNEQNDALNARLRAMYMNGNIRFLDILLGSRSINNFMTNIDRVQLLFESDAAVIEALQVQHQIVETHRQFLDGLEAELVAEQQKEIDKQAALRQNQEQVTTKRTEVSANIQALRQLLDAKNAEAEALIDRILRAQSDDDFVGGEMLWPVPGRMRISSYFGYRMHPILRSRRMHTGIDIPAPTGTSIVAANNGRVMISGWNNSFGNMIVIDHGGGITTLYAHNSENLVSVGDIVARGHQIARVGSTGMSTGPHLHFEVRRNGQHEDPLNWLR